MQKWALESLGIRLWILTNMATPWPWTSSIPDLSFFWEGAWQWNLLTWLVVHGNYVAQIPVSNFYWNHHIWFTLEASSALRHHGSSVEERPPPVALGPVCFLLPISFVLLAQRLDALVFLKDMAILSHCWLKKQLDFSCRWVSIRARVYYVSSKGFFQLLESRLREAHGLSWHVCS